MKESEKCLDPQLWHACAGGMVQMPSVKSKVYYFPQGHAEHSQSPIDFGNFPRVPASILSRVASVKFMADPESDEVFAKIRLVPLGQQNDELDSEEDEGAGVPSSEWQEKPACFAKTLTQSDANNGGGFSVPRYCAETMFPRLDYSADPPVQTVVAKDVHGEIWKLRHIYRGTPRRHLLTTGWSNFVNQKKLVAGDSIVFLRAENGDLCIGIRRANRGIGGGHDQPCGFGGWTPPFIRDREDDNASMMMMRRRGNIMRGKSKVRAESVIEAARLAGTGQAFEVVYYPRASTPEFCVKAGAVRAAMRMQWCAGRRFKMAFETEDSSRISWFMGTISSVQATDPVRWPNSPWRILQVSWDEPDLLQNVKNVSPWLVELVSNMPAINLTPFSPPRKKLRIAPYPELFNAHHHHRQNPVPPFSSTPHHRFMSTIATPASIQGARHNAQYGISLSDLHLNKLHSGIFHSPSTKFTTTTTIIDDDDISCLLTIGSPSTNKSCNENKKKKKKKTSQLVLFGQRIVAEEQISLTSFTNNSSSDESASRSR